VDLAGMKVHHAKVPVQMVNLRPLGGFRITVLEEDQPLIVWRNVEVEAAGG